MRPELERLENYKKRLKIMMYVLIAAIAYVVYTYINPGDYRQPLRPFITAVTIGMVAACIYSYRFYRVIQRQINEHKRNT